MPSALFSQQVVYVDGNLTSGANDGTSWENAIRLGRSVQLAINAASNGDEIRIASGTLTDNIQITVNKAVTITGGYDPSSGNRTAYTTLTGANTARRLVINGNLTIDLNYLIIENGGGSTNAGAGALLQANASPTFNNVVFQNNTGGNGGAVSISAGAAPTFKNVVFSGNSGTNGGAVYVINTSSETITFTNVVFANNTASRGGGIDNLNSATLNITNGTFYGNTGNGSGLFLGSNSIATMHNTVFYGNKANGDDQAFNAQNFSVISGSSYIASNAVAQAGSIGNNSTNYIALSANPFTNSSDLDGADNVFATSDDGLVPASGSALVGAGSNSLNSETTDISGVARVTGTIDIGAYESPHTLSVSEMNKNFSLHLYPNPASTTLSVFTDQEVDKIEVFSVTGKKLKSVSNSKTINISSFSNAIYIAKTYSKKGVAIRKFIKQ